MALPLVVVAGATYLGKKVVDQIGEKIVPAVADKAADKIRGNGGGLDMPESPASKAANADVAPAVKNSAPKP